MSAALHVLAVLLAWLAAATPERSRRRWLFGAASTLALAGLVELGGFLSSKWLGRLLMPSALVAVALGVGVGLGLRRGWPRAWVVGLAAVLAAQVGSSNVWVGTALVTTLEAPFHHVATPEDRLDAVVVLGGGTSRRPDGTPQLSPSGDRVMTAVRLYHAGATARLVCSGTAVAQGDQPARDLGHDTWVLLTEAGIPPDAIDPLGGPRNTREELAAFAKLARERGWTRVGLVTSAWHLRRALRHAQREGLVVTPIPADFRGGALVWSALELLPSAEGSYLTRLAAWEWLGAVVGR